MLRKITQAVGRYQLGALHDYPQGTWNKIVRDLLAASCKEVITDADVKLKLASFSEIIEFNPSHQSATRGTFKILRRLGSASAARH